MSISYEKVQELLDQNPAVSSLVIREGHVLAVGEFSNDPTPCPIEGVTMNDGLQYNHLEQYGPLSRENCEQILKGFAPEYAPAPQTDGSLNVTFCIRRGKYRIAITDTPVTTGFCIFFRKEIGILQ